MYILLLILPLFGCVNHFMTIFSKLKFRISLDPYDWTNIQNKIFNLALQTFEVIESTIINRQFIHIYSILYDELPQLKKGD